MDTIYLAGLVDQTSLVPLTLSQLLTLLKSLNLSHMCETIRAIADMGFEVQARGFVIRRKKGEGSNGCSGRFDLLDTF
jgi:hypothetical protein